MLKYFGTDGFRGKANIDLNVNHAFKIGRYLGFYFSNNGKIVIGKDTRRSSYMFECALTAGICASGADAYLMHVTSTPSISYIARVDDFNCGVMISASHNPYTDNGIKLLNENGEKMSDDFLEEIEKYLDGQVEGLKDINGNVLSMQDDLPLATGDKVGKAIDYASGRNRYVGYLISLVTHSYKDIKVALDCANGSAWMIAKSVFDAVGADTYVINNKPNGDNINLNCGSTHIENLQKYVVENNLDIGFAFDGDADRCLAVDSDGNLIDGDQIIFIYAKYMKDKGKLNKDTVVATTMSNYGLFKSLESHGINCIAADVGDRFVYEKMQQGQYILGGEQSGHIIFAKYANTGDGILTAIKLMQAILSKKSTVQAELIDYTKYPQITVNIEVEDKDKVVSNLDVQKFLKEVNKSLDGKGRALLRKSGTEPVIRIMCEAQKEEFCKEKIDNIIDFLKSQNFKFKIR